MLKVCHNAKQSNVLQYIVTNWIIAKKSLSQSMIVHSSNNFCDINTCQGLRAECHWRKDGGGDRQLFRHNHVPLAFYNIYP